MSIKHIFITSGKGGVGKDTLINSLKPTFKCDNTDYTVYNISSITPVVDVARHIIQNDEVLKSKPPQVRKLLSDLKKIMTDWDDIPMRYCLDKCVEIDNDNTSWSIVFVQIREASEILRCRSAMIEMFPGADITTLCISREGFEDVMYGNPSDDLSEEFSYDQKFIANNDLPLAILLFNDFIVKFICQGGM